jgi:hypothetical protein
VDAATYSESDVEALALPACLPHHVFHVNRSSVGVSLPICLMFGGKSHFEPPVSLSFIWMSTQIVPERQPSPHLPVWLCDMHMVGKGAMRTPDTVVRQSARKIPDSVPSRPGDWAENECQGLAVVAIAPVSADSLCKTGIFGVVAGDFRQLLPEHRRSGRPETKPNTHKARISGPFSRLLVGLAKCGNGWLATQC